MEMQDRRVEQNLIDGARKENLFAGGRRACCFASGRDLNFAHGDRKGKTIKKESLIVPEKRKGGSLLFLEEGKKLPDRQG